VISSSEQLLCIAVIIVFIFILHSLIFDINNIFSLIFAYFFLKYASCVLCIKQIDEE
jgi:hypothetical protein